MSLRRAAFLLLCVLLAAVVLAGAGRLLAADGLSVLDGLLLLALAGISPWAALAFGNAWVGLSILLFTRHPAAHVVPALRPAPNGPPVGRTAIAVCLRNEDMTGVVPPLERLLDGLPATHFDLWFLSDTATRHHRQAETTAINALRKHRPADADRIHLRRRQQNTDFKAGNVMEFLENEGHGYDYMLCLDADSEMSAGAVLSLVATMDAAPRIGILQRLIVGRPVVAAFPRLCQFGMRAGMRAWATGQGWWQAEQGPYWGHNALLRIQPFRDHGRLGKLPDGSAILSHDQVEAVRLHAAGWEVWCVPDEDGSLEGNPPALPEFLARDLRWAEGNMQYLGLLRAPGLTLMARWQLLQAVLLFLCAPLWVLAFVTAGAIAATGGFDAASNTALVALFLTFWALPAAPKLAGYFQVLVQGRVAARHGGRARFAAGMLAELVFAALLGPIRALHQSGFLLALSFGLRMGWKPQNRADRGVSWTDAARLLWPHTLAGVLAFAWLAATAPWALWFALPWAGGLLLAIPFCVFSTRPGVGQSLAAAGIAATPEEVQANSRAGSRLA